MRSRSVFVSVFSDTEASWWDVRERIKSFERLFEMNDMIRFTVGSRSFLMNSGGKSTTFLYLSKNINTAIIQIFSLGIVPAEGCLKVGTRGPAVDLVPGALEVPGTPWVCLNRPPEGCP